MPAEDPICLVPARGTEPGLPKQNFKELDGTPLVAHTIETALACDAFEDVFVSTESEALADLARRHGATVPFLRPDHLARDDVLLYEVVEHAVDRLQANDYVDAHSETPIVVLQANVPFRRPRDVDAALETFHRGHDAVISVVEDRHFYWQRDGDTLTPRFAARDVRDALEPFYRETGSINVTTPALLGQGTRVGDDPGFVVTDRLSALAVDSVLDFWLAERIADGPHVVFRVDGGDDLGMGHVARCLTLADELQAALRCEITFVSDPAYPSGIDAIRHAGYDLHADASDRLDTILALDPDLVFLDVLDTDPMAVRTLHAQAAAVITLEDTAGGLVHADFAVNALNETAADNGDPTHLAGADYFVLREEFHDHVTAPPERVERVLLTFGGSDPSQLSVLACRAVAGDDREYRLVVGPDFDAWSRLEAALSSAANVEVFENVDDMATQMAWADMAVAAGGRTAYELAATGTPTLVVSHNDREHDRARELADRGVVSYVGPADAVDQERLRAAIDELASDGERRRALSEQGATFVDGAGTRRIIDLVHDVLLG